VLTVAIVLIVISGFWSRVEFQAKRYMPWIALAKDGANSQTALLLDYFALPNLFTVYPAIRNRHFLVVLPILVGILLRVEVLLSVGLMGLQDVPLHEPLEVLVEESFTFPIPESHFGSLNTSIPTEVMMGVTAFNTSQPSGTTSRFAFQDFHALGAQPNPAPIHATVRGFTSILECQKASLIFQTNISLMEAVNTGGPGTRYPIDIANHYCNDTQGLHVQLNGNLPRNTTSVQYNFYINMACNSDHFSAVFTKWLVDTTNPSEYMTDLQLTESVALGCRFIHSLHDVEVTKTGSEVEVALAADPKSQRIDRDQDHGKRDINSRIFGSSIIFSTTETGAYSYKKPIALNYMLGLGIFANESIPDFFRPGALEASLDAFLPRYAAIMAHFLAKEKTQKTVIGDTSYVLRALKSSDIITHVMVGLFGAAALATVGILFLAPGAGLIRRAADTILDYAVLFSQTQVRAQLRGTGLSTIQQLRARLFRDDLDGQAVRQDRNTSWPDKELSRANEAPDAASLGTASGGWRLAPGSWYEPWSLLYRTQLTGMLILVALIALAAGLFYRSETSHGLATVSDDTYVRLLWTSLPAIAMTGVSLYCDNLFFTARTLAPFQSLLQGSRVGGLKSQSYLDETFLVTLSKSLRGRHWTILFATGIYILGSVLTIIISHLFSVYRFDVGSRLQVQQQTWFAPSNFSAEDSHDIPVLVSQLITHHNLSYLPGTYEDLVFPDLTLQEAGALNPVNTSIRARVPALRAQLNCTFWSGHNRLRLEEGSPDETYQSLTGSNCSFFPEAGWGPQRGRAFGHSLNAASQNGNWRVQGRCTWPWDFAFWWGAGDPNPPEPPITFAHYPYEALLLCKEEWTTVDVDATFAPPARGALAPTTAPAPDEASARPYPYFRPNAAYGQYDPADGVTCSQSEFASMRDLDCFFGWLATSRWAVPLDHLAAAAHEQEVVAAVKFLHGLLRAQLVHFGYGFKRTAYEQRVDVPPFEAARPPPIEGVVLVRGQKRLVQNGGPTGALIGVLGALLVLYVVAGRMVERRVVPKDPLSIAAMASLLADSNIYRYLPEGAEGMASQELGEAFRGKELRMGWFRDAEDGEKTNFTIGVVDDAFIGGVQGCGSGKKGGDGASDEWCVTPGMHDGLT